jgi:hypothetical protein
VQLGVENVELRAEGRFALAQLGGAGAEFLERDQLFLVAVDQPPQRVLRAREVALEPFATVAGWVLGAERLKPPVDLGPGSAQGFSSNSSTCVQTSSSISSIQTGRAAQTRPSGRRKLSAPEQR